MKFIKRFISEYDNVDEVDDGVMQFSGVTFNPYFAKLLESVKPGCTEFEYKYITFDPWDGVIEYTYYEDIGGDNATTIKFNIMTVTLGQVKDEAK